MNIVLKSARWCLVTVGIIMLTSFTIDATDTLNGSQSALSFLARSVTTEKCPADTKEFTLNGRLLCIDIYENSVGEDCVVGKPKSPVDTRNNLNDQNCQAVSLPDATPWLFVTQAQAANICAKKGARLPTPNEWYAAALGTPDTDVCNSNGSLINTGFSKACVSGVGAYDMVGNVWEWVAGEVVDGQYNGRSVPEEGYVSEIDSAGVAVVSTSSASLIFNEDYFWSKTEGVYAMMRGGFYGGGPDAGLYSTHSAIESSFSSGATGFRCVKDL